LTTKKIEQQPSAGISQAWWEVDWTSPCCTKWKQCWTISWRCKIFQIIASSIPFSKLPFSSTQQLPKYQCRRYWWQKNIFQEVLTKAEKAVAQVNG